MPAHIMLKIDLHIHTVHSDGLTTVREVARRAKKAGFRAGVCDHLSPYHKLYDAGAFDAYVAEVRHYNLFLGAEYCVGGEIPVDDSLLAELDYLLGGVHSLHVDGHNIYFWGNTQPDDFTSFVTVYEQVILDALEKGPLDVLAHPTYLPAWLQDRYEEIWTRSRCEKIWAAAAARGIALEISGRWLVPRPAQLQLAVEMGLTFALGSDAHRPDEIFKLEYPLAMVERLRIPEERIFIPRRRQTKR